VEKTRLRPLTRLVGENLARWRKERRLSLAQLSARVGDLGVPINLNSLNKIEHANRGIDLDELVALARALNVSPLVLVFPLGRERVVEVLPGTDVDTWAAVQWFTGEGPFPGDGDVGGTVLDDYRAQDRLVGEWRAMRRQLDEERAHPTHPDRPDLQYAVEGRLEFLLDTVEDQLRRHRANMIRDGVDPGVLPAEVAHVDEG
jgi:transcriptional regulator with XRE-family HTH domain